jgi:hypothetical protein
MNTLDATVSLVPVPPMAVQRCGLDPVTFADGYSGSAPASDLTALEIARAVFENPPRIMSRLLALRNLMVRPFGLKTPEQLGSAQEKVGVFPLISASENEVIVGGDDKHLDFRIWISVQRTEDRCTVTASTVVKTHNRFGRFYLAMVMPFHRLLSRIMLERGLRRLADRAAISR